MPVTVKSLIEQKDTAGLSAILTADPSLANIAISIPYDASNKAEAHPLHRLCDAVFCGKMTNAEAIEIAKLFLHHGANIDGFKTDSTPLIAAASLSAEELAIFYVGQGADINFVNEDDRASALHWAAYCGLDKLVSNLIASNAILDEQDKKYQSTPLAWALHAIASGQLNRGRNQIECAKLLLQAGADTNKIVQDQHRRVLSGLKG